jgi:hypothetical protein
MCILFRVRTIGKAFQRELAQRKIPTINSAPDTSSGPYKRALAIDLLAYIRVAVNDSDPEAFNRCLNRPARGLGKQAAEKLLTNSRRWSTSLWVTAERCAKHGGCDLSPSQKSGLAEFVKIIRSIKADYAQDNPEDLPLSAASRVLRNVYNRVFQGSAKAKAVDDPVTIRAMIDTMIDDLELLTCDGLSLQSSSFECITKGMLSRFTGLVGKNPADIKKEKNRAVVTLSTVHQAKGLEFQHVFLVRFNDSFFPLPIRPVEGEDEESFEGRRIVSIREERRLAYVAVSRAQFSLHISWVTNGQEGMIVSRFIEDLPSECLQNQKDADLESEIISTDSSRPSSFQPLLQKDRIASDCDSVEVENADFKTRTKPPLFVQCAKAKAAELSSPSPPVLPRLQSVDDERKAFRPRGGWDPSLPSATGISPRNGFGNVASPCNDLFRSRQISQRSNNLELSAVDRLDRFAFRSPATVNQKRAVQFIQQDLLETETDDLSSQSHSFARAHDSLSSVHGKHAEIRMDENLGCWKSGMKNNIMANLPNLLQSATDNVCQKKRPREEFLGNSRNHEKCWQASTSVQLAYQLEQGLQSCVQIKRKPFVPSFLLDPEDEEDEDEDGKAKAFECAPRKLEHVPPTIPGPLNFSWGRYVFLNLYFFSI